MFGIIYFIYFLVMGLAIANRVFAKNTMYVRVWVGLVFGIVSQMWCVVPFSFIFKFSLTSHFLSLILMFGIYLIIKHFFKEKGEMKYLSDGEDVTLFTVSIPIIIITLVILYTHVIMPGKDGNLYCGQSTFGDLNLHLGIITSIATQGVFPPEYSIFPGQILAYPFLVNSLSSSLYLLGTPLNISIIIPSSIMIICLIFGFYILAYTILKHKFASAIATILYFFNGGFGFIYFLDGIKTNPSNFYRMFTAWYNTPTNYNENSIRWSNTICDMIIPQRTTMAGWMVIVLAIWLMYIAVKENSRKHYVVAGIVAGLMPMIHTHSFLAFGIICVVWFFVYLFYDSISKTDLKKYILNWVIFGGIVAILSLPQLLYWTFPQSSGGGFL